MLYQYCYATQILYISRAPYHTPYSIWLRMFTIFITISPFSRVRVSVNIDEGENALSSIYDTKHYEVKYWYFGCGLKMNGQIWNVSQDDYGDIRSSILASMLVLRQRHRALKNNLFSLWLIRQLAIFLISSLSFH